MNKQRGLSLSGLIFTAFILVLVAILGFKIVPYYLEYRTIQRIFESMAEDPALRKATKAELDRSWAARTSIDPVRSMAGENIEYTKTADGLLISAEYSVKVPIVRNVSVCIDFNPSSK